MQLQSLLYSSLITAKNINSLLTNRLLCKNLGGRHYLFTIIKSKNRVNMFRQHWPARTLFFVLKQFVYQKLQCKVINMQAINYKNIYIYCLHTFTDNRKQYLYLFQTISETTFYKRSFFLLFFFKFLTINIQLQKSTINY